MTSTAFVTRRRAGLFVIVSAVLAAVGALIVTNPTPRARADSTAPYANFEGPQVHPIALTPNGMHLLAVNTPNATLSVFDLSSGAPTLSAEIPVGLEPVSVAARSDAEAWVVNWLSDSVSVVDLTTGNVTRTIQVGDEPGDVVFAGPSRGRAFVSVGGARLVKVLDAADPARTIASIPIRGRQPRGLATDSTGDRVFVSVFQSGNGTTIVPPGAVKALGGAPKPSPAVSPDLPRPPDVALIVKQKGKKWVDERGKGRWKRYVKYTLADVDVVVLDATSPTPAIAREIRSVGTNIDGVAFDPSSNRIFVANAEAHNLTRFEPNLRGRFVDSRVSIVDLASPATARAVDLNSHVDFDDPAGSEAERAMSLALPTDLVRASDGSIYVAAMGSAKIARLDDSGHVADRIDVGNGPTGLALDEARGQLYVLNRTDETVSVVDLSTAHETSHIAIGANPEPDELRAGRRLFYDTSFSAHGTVACASCHLNGHVDGLAWDLGDPNGQMSTVTGPPLIDLFPISHTFHPMKGPMVTQSLRATSGTEPLHWRGDRADLDAFNPAFMSLLGAPRVLSPSELAPFEAFVRSLSYPPNPNENLDRTLANPPTGPSAARGRNVYVNERSDRRIFSCNDCHTVTPNYGPGTNGLIIPGIVLVGIDNVAESQDIKVPQLRGTYEKAIASFQSGERVDGFGLIHDGVIDNLDTFLRTANFSFSTPGARDDLVAFVMALDTGTAPAVGLQVTMRDASESTDEMALVELLVDQAEKGNCDLVATDRVNGGRRTFVYSGGRTFAAKQPGLDPIGLDELVRSAGPGAEVTFTGVAPGRGAVVADGWR